MTPVKLLVTILVAVPLMVWIGWPQPMWKTASIAIAAIGLGTLAEQAVARPKTDTK